ncbi:pyridoxal phosphate-dependent aminotransferase [Paralcaligenes ureilyticus]|nr:pyridoxal phosphate-dependent aminotransferase [Paralcaligenes ureilyticus]
MNVSANRVVEIRKNSLRGKLLAGSGKSAVSLAIGEPGFVTPGCIVQAQAYALAQGLTHYAAQTGDPLLVKAILKHVVPEQSSLAGSNNILITHGGTAGLSCSILGLVNPGDVVLIENPTYSLYADAIRLAGGVVKSFGRHSDGGLDFEEIRSLAPAAKMIIVCQPSNPAGTILSAAEWRKLAQVARESDLIVLSDEAYDGIVFDGCEFVSALSVPELADRLIVCRTFSKKYAMTGWRVGYLVGTAELIAAASTVHRTFNGAVNTANQRAAAVALEQASQDAEAMRVEFQERRALMVSCLQDKGPLQFAIPSGAFYLWVGYPEKFGDSQEMADKCLSKGVHVRPGSEFGPGGKYRIRLSFAPDRECIVEGCRRFLSAFKGC